MNCSHCDRAVDPVPEPPKVENHYHLTISQPDATTAEEIRQQFARMEAVATRTSTYV